MARRVPVALLVALAMLPGTRVAKAGDESDAAARARDILADPAYQGDRPGGALGERFGLPGVGHGREAGGGAAERPGDSRPSPGAAPSSGADVPAKGDSNGQATGGQEAPGGSRSDRGRGAETPADRGPRSERRDPTPPASPSASGQVFGTLLLAVLGVGLVLLLGLGVLEIVRRRARADSTPGPAAATAPVRAQAPAAIGAAEALARDGRYAEAIHVMLQNALARLAAAGGLPLDDAMTSREVLAGARLDDASRSALGELVSAVELSLFGGADVTEERYARCVESYRRIAGPAGEA